MKHSQAARQDVHEQPATCTKDMYDNTANTLAGERWKRGTASRLPSNEPISSRQTWQIWKHQQHADMNKHEHQQQAHRHTCQHTQQPDIRNMKRADLTNRNINSRQTGQCGKETAARQKRYATSNSRNTLTAWQTHMLSAQDTNRKRHIKAKHMAIMTKQKQHEKQVDLKESGGKSRHTWNIWEISSLHRGNTRNQQ